MASIGRGIERAENLVVDGAVHGVASGARIVASWSSDTPAAALGMIIHSTLFSSMPRTKETTVLGAEGSPTRHLSHGAAPAGLGQIDLNPPHGANHGPPGAGPVPLSCLLEFRTSEDRLERRRALSDTGIWSRPTSIALAG